MEMATEYKKAIAEERDPERKEMFKDLFAIHLFVEAAEKIRDGMSKETQAVIYAGSKALARHVLTDNGNC